MQCERTHTAKSAHSWFNWPSRSCRWVWVAWVKCLIGERSGDRAQGIRGSLCQGRISSGSFLLVGESAMLLLCEWMCMCCPLIDWCSIESVSLLHAWYEAMNRLLHDPDNDEEVTGDEWMNNNMFNILGQYSVTNPYAYGGKVDKVKKMHLDKITKVHIGFYL